MHILSARFQMDPLSVGQHSSVCATSWSGGVGDRGHQPCTALAGAKCQTAPAPGAMPCGCLPLGAGASAFWEQTRRACPGKVGHEQAGRGCGSPEKARSISMDEPPAHPHPVAPSSLQHVSQLTPVPVQLWCTLQHCSPIWVPTTALLGNDQS